MSLDAGTQAVVEPPYFRVFGPYTGREPAFYPPENFSWTETLRREWRAIRGEFERYIQADGLLEEHFVPDRVKIRGWQGVKLFTARRPYRKALRAFSHTAAVLSSVPEIASASFSVLQPGGSLPLHHGDTNLFYRAHLGLIVPGPLEQCGIEVAGERRAWEEGEVLIFNDAHQHRVWNLTDRPRVVLLCDVFKPTYGGASWRNCAQVLATVALLYVQFRVPALRQVPIPITRWMLGATSVPFWLYLLACGWPRRGR